jgi:hypothetical protein
MSERTTAQPQPANPSSGAQAPARLLQRQGRSSGLAVNRPGDQYEREANSMAEMVMQSGGATPTFSLSTLPIVQRAATRTEDTPRTAPAIVDEVLHTPGQPLESAARAFLEPRLGHNFSRVRVHDDARAAESARAVGARAYAVGQDIVFGAGQYAPATSDGRRLLVHELAHVIQQGAAAAPGNLAIADPRDQVEQAAERAADRAAAGETITLPAATGQSGARLRRQKAQDDKNVALVGGSLARYNLDKEGKIQGWEMDKIAAQVVQALLASKNAYISVNGYYPMGDTDFDPNVPVNTARNALIQWIGKSKIPDIEKRIVTYHGSGGSFAPKIGGSVEITLQFSSLEPGAIPPGSTAQVAPQPGGGRATPSDEPDEPIQVDVNIYSIELSLNIPRKFLPARVGQGRFVEIKMKAELSGDISFSATIGNDKLSFQVFSKVGTDKGTVGGGASVFFYLGKCQIPTPAINDLKEAANSLEEALRGKGGGNGDKPSPKENVVGPDNFPTPDKESGGEPSTLDKLRAAGQAIGVLLEAAEKVKKAAAGDCERDDRPGVGFGFGVQAPLDKDSKEPPSYFFGVFGRF